MPPALFTTPTFIMSPDLPVMPTSVMPSTTQPAATPSVSHDHSRPLLNFAVVYIILAVSVIGLAIVSLCAWYYFRRHKLEDIEAANSLENNETKVRNAREGIQSTEGKAPDTDTEEATSDKIFIIGGDDDDDDSDMDSKTENDDTKRTANSKEVHGDMGEQVKYDPQAFFNSTRFSISGVLDSSFATTGSDSMRDVSSLFSKDDRASVDSYVSDTMRISTANWAAIKQAVVDRMSSVQQFICKIEEVHLQDTSLEAQILGHAEDTTGLETQTHIGASIDKCVENNDEFQIAVMDRILAEIDPIGDLYSSDTSSAQSESNNMSTVESSISAGARLGRTQSTYSDEEATHTTQSPTAVESPVVSHSARITHCYSSDFRLSTSALSIQSDSSSGDYIPLPLIRPLNINKNPATSTPVHAVRSALAARPPVDVFKFPDQNSLCRAVLEASPVHPHNTLQNNANAKIFRTPPSTAPSHCIGRGSRSSFRDAFDTEQMDTQFEIVATATNRIGMPANCIGSGSSSSSTWDDSLASTSMSSSSPLTYEEREREAISNWSSLLHSSFDSDCSDPFDTFCMNRISRAAHKGKGRSTDTRLIPIFFSRFPIDDGEYDVSSCSFVFDAWMDSFVSSHAANTSIDVKDNQGLVPYVPEAVSIEQLDKPLSASATEVTPDVRPPDHDAREARKVTVYELLTSSIVATQGLCLEKKIPISVHGVDESQVLTQLHPTVCNNAQRNDIPSANPLDTMSVSQGLPPQMQRNSSVGHDSEAIRTAATNREDIPGAGLDASDVASYEQTLHYSTNASSAKATSDALLSDAIPQSVVAAPERSLSTPSVKPDHPPKRGQSSPTVGRYHIPTRRQIRSTKFLACTRNTNNTVDPEPSLRTTPIKTRPPPISERRSQDNKSPQISKTLRQPARPGSLIRTLPRVPVPSSATESPTAARKFSTPPRIPRARSKTIVAHRETSGTVGPCKQQSDVRVVVSARGNAVARQTLTSNRSWPGLLRGSTGRTELGRVQISSTPGRTLAERQSAGKVMGSPAKRTSSRAHDPSSPCSRTFPKTASKTNSGLPARSAPVVTVHSPVHSSRTASASNAQGSPSTAIAQQRSRSSTLITVSTRFSSLSSPGSSRSLPVSTRSSSDPSRSSSVPSRSPSVFSRSPLVSSSLPNSPRTGHSSKSREPRKSLRTIAEDAQENSPQAVDKQVGLTLRQKGLLQPLSTRPSSDGTTPNSARNTRTSGGIRSRSISKPPSIWH